MWMLALISKRRQIRIITLPRVREMFNLTTATLVFGQAPAAALHIFFDILDPDVVQQNRIRIYKRIRPTYPKQMSMFPSSLTRA